MLLRLMVLDSCQDLLAVFDAAAAAEEGVHVLDHFSVNCLQKRIVLFCEIGTFKKEE